MPSVAIYNANSREDQRKPVKVEACVQTFAGQAKKKM